MMNKQNLGTVLRVLEYMFCSQNKVPPYKYQGFSVYCIVKKVEILCIAYDEKAWTLSARGRGTALNTKKVFKPAASASPLTNDDFSAVSRGRASSSRHDTSSKRALLASINESTASAGEEAPAGQTAMVGAAAANAPAKRALKSSLGALTATQEALLEEQTQDAAGQAAAPALQFEVLHVRSMRACACLWLMVCMQCCCFRHSLSKRAFSGPSDSLLSCRATSMATTAASFRRCMLDLMCRSVFPC